MSHVKNPKSSFEPNSIHFPNATNPNPVASIEELVIDLHKRFQIYDIPVARFHFDDWWYDHKGTVLIRRKNCRPSIFNLSDHPL